jgi:Xaa-Pro aminopeptidase
MDATHLERQARLRRRLAEAGVAAAVVPPSGDLVYLTGLHMHLSERLALLVLPVEGEAVVVLPAFEASRVPAGLRTVPWEEDQDPLPLLVAELPDGAARVALGERVAASEVLGIAAARPELRLVALERVTGGVRAIKQAGEIEALRGAAAATDRAYAALLREPLAGSSERAVAARLAAAMRAEGLDDTFTIVASGPNAAFPHHVSGERVIQRGDGVLFDFGGRWEGYLSDVTRTVSVGEPSARLREVHAAVAAAQAAGKAALAPGARLGDVDAAARGSLAAAGLAHAFTHRLGHGLGLEIHEPPYLRGDNDQRAEVGHVVTIEPGVYLAGELGVRIEDDVLVTEDGCESLTNAPRALLVVE